MNNIQLVVTRKGKGAIDFPVGPTGFYISGKWAPPGTFERGRKNFRDRFGC